MWGNWVSTNMLTGMLVVVCRNLSVNARNSVGLLLPIKMGAIARNWVVDSALCPKGHWAILWCCVGPTEEHPRCSQIVMVLDEHGDKSASLQSSALFVSLLYSVQLIILNVKYIFTKEIYGSGLLHVYLVPTQAINTSTMMLLWTAFSTTSQRLCARNA